jgi:hypothetical protein
MRSLWLALLVTLNGLGEGGVPECFVVDSFAEPLGEKAPGVVAPPTTAVLSSLLFGNSGDRGLQ